MSSYNCVGFFGPDWKTKMAVLASGWDIFNFSFETATEFGKNWQEARSLFFLCNYICWTKFKETWQGKISTSSILFGMIGKPRCPPWHVICWSIFVFSATTQQISMKLDTTQDPTVLYQVCVFRSERNTMVAAMACTCLAETFSTSPNRWTEFNET